MSMQQYTILVNRPPSEEHLLIFEERQESPKEFQSDPDDNEDEHTENYSGATNPTVENDDAQWLRIRGCRGNSIVKTVKDAMGSAMAAAMSSSSLLLSAATSAAESAALLTASKPRATRSHRTSIPYSEKNSSRAVPPANETTIKTSHGRKRPVTTHISAKSALFKAARQIRNQVSVLSVGDLDAYHDEWLKFALATVLKPEMSVLRIAHQIHRSANETCHNDRTPHKSRNYRNGKRRPCPSVRSSYFKTIWMENKSGGAEILTKIISNPLFYPLYLTVQRWINAPTVAQPSKSIGNPPPRKRKKTDTSVNCLECEVKSSQNGVTVTPICLLDSSDEEEEKQPKAEEKQDGGCSQKADTSDRATSFVPPSFMQTKLLSMFEPPPDPLPNSFKAEENGDFVLTPYGAGKIVSYRVDRHASTFGEASIYKPIIIYSIDLHFGFCHVPSSQIRSISGTSYVKKALLTYNKVPLTAMDLLRLRPMTYLNDSIVNFYLKYLKDRLEKDTITTAHPISRGWDALDGDGVHIFPSFCYNRIVNTMGSDNRNNKANRLKIWKELKTWTKGVDIFKKKMLVFPINDKLHWSALFVFHPGRVIRRHTVVDVDSVIEVADANAVDMQHQIVQFGSNDNDTIATSTEIKGNLLASCADLTRIGDSKGGQAEDSLASVKKCLERIVLQIARPSDTADPAKTITSIPTNKNQSVKTSSEPAKPTTRWLCNYCNTAIFDTFVEAEHHEQTCPKNQNWCMLHFDSGKHFKLHDSQKICGFIRKYLSAYYDSEYASTHPGVGHLTQVNMPGYTSLAPQQENTKDCAVYMLEIVEQILSNPPVVDNDFVKNKCKVFARDLFPKDLIEKKREDILQLVHTLRLGETVD